ncbi:MAG: class I SAM-dependent methyltransferase [Candidatus Omnitrophica bacterium]|nr:class I SAM-dependent methyltransferase [Candidatus Omnitrophota bacterium]
MQNRPQKTPYEVSYIKCKVCGKDDFKFLGLRGNLEYLGAPALEPGKPHMITNVVRCKRCGFVYTNPYVVSEEGKDFYSDPDQYRSSCSAKEEEMFKETLSLINRIATKGKLLDIGCGKGEFLALAKESGWEACGVETSGGLADYSRKRYDLKIENVPLEKVKYPDKHFDIITLNMVLEHIDEPNDLIKEVYRISKEDGAVIIEVPNTNSLLLKAIRIFFLIRGKNWSPLLSPLHKPYHTYGYSNHTLRFLLNSHNFKIVKVINGSLFNRGLGKRPEVNGLLRMGGLFTTFLGATIGMGDVITVIAKKRRKNPK